MFKRRANLKIPVYDLKNPSELPSDYRILTAPLCGKEVFVQNCPQGLYIRVLNACNSDSLDCVEAEVLINETTLCQNPEKVLWIHHVNICPEFSETYLPELLKRVLQYAKASGYTVVSTIGKSQTLPMKVIDPALFHAGFSNSHSLYMQNVDRKS